MKASVRPAFWQRQPQLPPAIRKFLTKRLELALANPGRRTVLAWPAILGAPVQRQFQPDGIPEVELLRLAESMVQAVGAAETASAWTIDRGQLEDTAESGPQGWTPHASWEAFAHYVSLRSGVTLLALTGRPEDERYLLDCAKELFNVALFHECHDALEMLWRRETGELKRQLQGLILLAAGFHHQQQHRVAGMRGTWRDAMVCLEGCEAVLNTPWGRLGYAESLAMASERLDWLKHEDTDLDWPRFWALPPPRWS